MHFEDNYKNVPHRGEIFEQGGERYYWNFSSAPVGTVVCELRRAYDVEKGRYYGVITHVRVVESSSVDGMPTTKWQLLPQHGSERIGDPDPHFSNMGIVKLNPDKLSKK